MYLAHKAFHFSRSSVSVAKVNVSLPDRLHYWNQHMANLGVKLCFFILNSSDLGYCYFQIYNTNKQHQACMAIFYYYNFSIIK